MAQYLSPGVYVEEKPSGEKPIEGVGTSTGAFVGIAERGPIGEAEQIANWTQFVNKFGGYLADGYLAYAVNQFFAEGGTRCFVVRTCHYTDITDAATKTSVPSAATLMDNGGNPSMRVQASSDGTWGDFVADPKAGIDIEVKTATELAGGFQLVVKYKGAEVEIYDNLTIANVENEINNKSAYIVVEKDSWDGVTGSGNIPDVAASVPLAGGNDGLAGITGTDFLGDGSSQTGIHAFDVVDDINIVAIPDRAGDRDVIIGGLTYCQDRKDCFFIADPPSDLDPTTVEGFKKGTIAPYIGNAFNSSYGALYYPWVIINDPRGGKRYMPPSGAVAGTYAHTDAVRGVHKAPAGIIEGYLDSVSGVQRIVTKSEHDGLNPAGINVIRKFPTSGICIWGTRTLSADPEWRYLNIRRLFLFLEESIDKGTQWVVFEPNSPALWGSVKRNITSFLLRVWRDGALFGSTPEEAFFVKVDAENNPEEVRNAGQLIIDVGVAPVRPAEFVIIRITQKTQSK